MPELLVGDVTDKLDVFQLLNLLVVANGNGEHQFVVFATVQGAGSDVHVHLFSHHGGLVVDRQLLLKDAAADARLFADVQQFAAEAVADVHHGGGADAGLAQPLDDVATGFRLQLALQQVLLAAEVGLEVRHGLALFLGFINHLVVDALLALQELQSHIGGTEVAADADKVGVAGPVAVDDVLLAGFADTGDADGQTRI